MAEKKQKTIIAPDNYYELRKPWDSVKEAEAAFDGFWKEFYELRNKCRVADVYVIAMMPVKDGGDVMSSMHAGNSLNSEAMTAWAYGFEASKRKELMARILADHE